MGSIISSWVLINDNTLTRNGAVPASLTSSANLLPEDVYRQLGYSYPKFFKMDILSKWAWLGAELLLHNDDTFMYDGLDKNKVGIVLATAHGCLEADKKYNDTLATIPSPALFVYTLPNIMLGEISIRHGFKGEQACLVSDRFNSDEIYFWVNDLMEQRGMEACLMGWVDVTADKREVCLFWVTKLQVKNSPAIPFSAAALQQYCDSVGITQ